MKKLENVKFQDLVVGNAKAILCLLLVFVSVFTVKGQENTDNHIKLDVKQKSQQELQAIQGFLASPSASSPQKMKKSAGVTMQKSTAASTVSRGPANNFEGKSKEAALMEILLIKNQIFESKDMPTSRKRLNVNSLLDDLKGVLSEEEFSRLISDQDLLKQLGLFVDETLEKQ